MGGEMDGGNVAQGTERLSPWAVAKHGPIR